MTTGAGLMFVLSDLSEQAVPLLFEALLVMVMSAMLQQTEKEIEKDIWARSFLRETKQLAASLAGAAASAQEYGNSGDSSDHKKYKVFAAKLDPQIEKVKELAAGHLDLIDPVCQLESILKETRSRLERGLVLIENGDIVGSFRLLLPMVPAMKRLTDMTDRLGDAAEAAVSSSTERQIQIRESVMRLLAFGIMVNVLIAFALAGYFNSGTAKRLSALMENTRLFSSKQPLLAPLGGADELAGLGLAFA